MWRSIGLPAAGLVIVTLGVWWMKTGSSPTTGVEAAQPAARVPQPLVSGTGQRNNPRKLVDLWPGRVLHDPVVIGPCPIAPVAEQDISSQVEGMLHELKVQLGQQVRAGQVVARLDDRLLRPQVELLQIKASSDAARLIAKGQLDESDANLTMARKLTAKNAIGTMEFRQYLYQRDRHAEELRKAEEDQEVAGKELAKARQTLDLYQIKSLIDGEVTRIYRRTGETVKDTEPLVCVTNFDRVRVDGLCKMQNANLLQVGMHALVEPEMRGEQVMELGSHTAAITSVAVAADGRLLASASEDRTVLLWQWPQATRLVCLRHPAEVLAVAIAPAAEAGYLVLTGAADGRGRLWTVAAAGNVSEPIVLADGHGGAVRAVAFSRDGKRCATGGEDRKISLWDATGRLLFSSPEAAHHGAITALHFTPEAHLVSAARDNTLKVWKLDDRGMVLVAEHQGRTGDVTALDVSPDGQRLLFDQGEELKLVERDSGAVLGSLRSQRQGRFACFAHFAASGTAVVSANNGRLQLWKVPVDADLRRQIRQAYALGLRRDKLAVFPAVTETLQSAGLLTQGAPPRPNHLWALDGFEARYYLPPTSGTITCGCFGPGDSVIFTGGADRVVRAWAAPASPAAMQPLEGVITYVGSQVERGTDAVRVRVELENPRDPSRRLRAGTYANLRIYPETAAKP